MLTMVADHLWQSTLFAAAAMAVALLLRRQASRVRYALWLAASLKFLVPFAALVAVGGALSWRTLEVVPYAETPLLLEAAAEPFSRAPLTVRAPVRQPATAPLLEALPGVALGLWASGAAVCLTMWFVRWRRIRRVVRSATRLQAGREVETVARLAPLHGVRTLPVLATDTALEPGVFGIVRPVLLWPRAIAEHLDDRQIEAILAHELCHLRRRDNLAAACHMAVQTIFWFHPLVWWIGARLVDERERACDEEVIRLGNEPDVYAESILKTCKFFLEAPATCVAGVTGSDLKRRIEQIMSHEPPGTPAAWRQGLLAAAGVMAFVTPVAVGALNPPPQTRAVTAPGALPSFDAISIRPNTSSGRGGRSGGQMQPGRFVVQNATLRTIIRRAYGADGRALGNSLDLFEQQVAGGPEWVDRDRFDIVATTVGPTPSPEMRLMVQRMLADRFKLAAHWETRELPVYVLTTARADGRLGPGLTVTTDEQCAAARGTPMPPMPPQPGQPAPPQPCGSMQFGPGALIASGVQLQWLAASLTNIPVISGIDRIVLDRTGLTGNYGFTLKFSAAGASNPDPDRPALTTALEEQLGLKLEPSRQPVEVLVIDSVERPDAN